MPDFNRSRQVWHDHIARWGGGANNGKIIRGGVERLATMAMSEYSPRERATINVDGAVRFMVSALNVSEANIIDNDVDVIQFKGKQYKIVLPPKGQQPDGTWIGFDCTCTYQRAV
jgi:hypothetical protein